MTFVALGSLTWVEARDIAANPAVIGLVPLGSLEQHGPHLPLLTDSLIAEVIAADVAELIASPVVVAPVVPGGLSVHHTGFPGTVTFSEEAYRSIVLAYIDALARTGIWRVALFSAHGGNFGLLGEIASAVSAERPELTLRVYDDFVGYVQVMVAGAQAAGLEVPVTDIHAGGLETSQALAAFPHLVRDYHSVEGYTAAEDGWLDRLTSDGAHALSATGVFGSPPLASSEAGVAIFGALARELAGWISREFDVALHADGSVELRSGVG